MKRHRGKTLISNEYQNKLKKKYINIYHLIIIKIKNTSSKNKEKKMSERDPSQSKANRKLSCDTVIHPAEMPVMDTLQCTYIFSP